MKYLPFDAELDRAADLHYAFQFGQDAVREDYASVEAEFMALFAEDAEAHDQFRAGVEHARARQGGLH